MIQTRIRGLDRIIAKADPQLLAAPLRRFWNKAGVLVQGRAEEKAPRNFGELASSITYEVDPAALPLWTKVGTNQGVRAKAMEYGTGLLSEAPDSKGGVHFPPWGDRNPGLERWAELHGFENGFVVARGIARRGGLKPRRYLRGALEEMRGQIASLVDGLGREVRELWDKR